MDMTSSKVTGVRSWLDGADRQPFALALSANAKPGLFGYHAFPRGKATMIANSHSPSPCG